MREHEFYLPSSDENFQLRCMEWIPDGEVKAVLQITHGMTEHIGRYGDFAAWLADHGIAVIGHDHLGHGKTAKCADDFGYFGTHGGMTCVVKDIRRITVYAKKKYPDKKLILLGHSMGSFLTRRYMSVYQDGPDGFILMGTGAPAEPMVFAGKILAWMISRFRGKQFRSKLLYQMSLGNYNRKFAPNKSTHDWLTRDDEWLLRSREDVFCQFIFTATAYYDFFKLILQDAREERRKNVRVDVPILVISGGNDPVGEDGKGVRIVYQKYVKAGAEDITLKLYDGARHEIIHETNRDEVFEDIFAWLNQKA